MHLPELLWPSTHAQSWTNLTTLFLKFIKVLRDLKWKKKHKKIWNSKYSATGKTQKVSVVPRTENITKAQFHYLGSD